LPKEIGKLTQLTNLDLDRCENLKFLPKEIGKLTQLTHLGLVNCKNLEFLPKEIGKLTQLTTLDLTDCFKLISLPKDIGKLTQLTRLSLVHCPTMGDLRSLQYLLHLPYSTRNCLRGKQSTKLYGQALTEDICQFTTLTDLRIDGYTSKIVQLGDQLSKLVNLKTFHIYRFYELETLPDAIQSMVCLEEFCVDSCTRIKILPSWILLFSKLKVLILIGLSSLESLPALNTLKMLSTLNIIGCGLIKKLPDSFTSSDAFPSLKELDCSECGLVESRRWKMVPCPSCEY
jgi:Leucine-rich repeat (LRR) protein